MNVFIKNLRHIAIIRVCFAMLFCSSVITLFWKNFGLDLLDIFWLQAIFAIAVALFEIPTGYLGDRLGRKKTLLLATGIAACGWCFYALSHTFWQFVVAEIVLGLAFGFLSGTDTSLVYESLAELKATADFTRIEGRQFSGNLIGEAAAALAGGFIAAFWPVAITLWLTGLAALAAFIAVWGIHEPRHQPSCQPHGTWHGLYKISRFVFLRSRLVRLAVPLLAASSLATMLGVWLYQPLWQERQVPVWLFGVLWAALSLPASLASHWAHAAEKRFGQKAVLWSLAFPPVIGYLILALVPGYGALLGPYIVNILRGSCQPILGRYIHEETFDDKRATVLSIQSWLYRVSFFILGPVVGWIGQKFGLPAAFWTCAVISGVSLGLLLPALVRQVGAAETIQATGQAG